MEYVREKTCCFTGHRELPLRETDRIKKNLDNEIGNLIEQGVVYYFAGGALGFDTLAAERSK